LKESLQAGFGSQVEGVVLTPSHGGRFEVTVNGRLIYSKLATGRHAQPGEVEGLVRKILEKES
jgi:selenoprotein W-related protein